MRFCQVVPSCGHTFVWFTWVTLGYGSVRPAVRDGILLSTTHECKDPAPIDGSLYQGIDVNIHRATNIEGYCGRIAAGKVKVGFSIGNCGDGASSKEC